MNDHASYRASSRMADSLPTDTVHDITRTADAFAAKCGPFESVALRLRSLSAFVGQAWGDESNGDQVIAIIRNRQVQTLMYRRSTQPFNPAAFNVTRTVTL